MMTMTRLGRLIDTRLAELSWTRVQLADELGVVAVSVSRWLRPEGDCPIPWRHYAHLARVLNIPLRDVLAAAEKDWPAHVQQYRRYLAHGPSRSRRH